MNETKNNELIGKLVIRTFCMFPEALIIGIDKNKVEEDLIVALEYGVNGLNNSIYIIGEKCQKAAEVPFIHFTEHSKENGLCKHKYIYICDVQTPKHIRRNGNASVAMKALINYAKKREFECIKGDFSSIDNDTADARQNFYKKCGFTIEDSHIELKLTTGK